MVPLFTWGEEPHIHTPNSFSDTPEIRSRKEGRLAGTGRFVFFFPLFPPFSSFLRSEKSSLNIKFLGGIFLGHPGPRRRDIPDKNFMQVAFSCFFRQGGAGMSRDLGRDVPDLEKLYARNFGLIFSYPIFSQTKRGDSVLETPFAKPLSNRRPFKCFVCFVGQTVPVHMCSRLSARACPSMISHT